MRKKAIHYITTTVLIAIGLIALFVMVSEPAYDRGLSVLPNLCAIGVIWADVKVAGWLAKHDIIQTDIFDDVEIEDDEDNI